MRKCEDGVMIVTEYEKMWKNERSNISRIASKQGYVLSKFRESKKFVEMMEELGMSISTINFKII